MDLDLRKLRYFAAVAEHRHFGRAAAQLYIAQPVLSRQIRALEQDLGCALLVRTTRSVELTPAGEQLREETRGVFGAVDTAVRRVLEVERGVERLVVGFAPGLHVSEVVRIFGAARPEVTIDLLQLRWWEQDAPLRDGRVDVGHLRWPFDATGLRTVSVGSEPKVACLPLHHPLAGRAELTARDLEGHAVLNSEVRRSATLEEKFELVASGYGIALVPRSVARSYSRPDVVHRTMADAAPLETCVAVVDDRRERRVLDFVDLAVETLRAAADGMSDLGGARRGDRTLLDALYPAADELASSGSMSRAAAAADEGAEATAQMSPRRGRASYLGDRARGQRDAGAEAVGVVLAALARA